jgi:tetratricopeptide (TPR) repeat protein
LLLHVANTKKEVLGEKHIKVVSILNNLISVYEAQGKYEEDEKSYSKALAMLKETVGEKHPHYKDTLDNLQKLYKLQGKK